MEIDFLFDDLGLDFIPPIVRLCMVFSVILIPMGVLFAVVACLDDGVEDNELLNKKKN